VCFLRGALSSHSLGSLVKDLQLHSSTADPSLDIRFYPFRHVRETTFAIGLLAKLERAQKRLALSNPESSHSDDQAIAAEVKTDDRLIHTVGEARGT